MPAFEAGLGASVTPPLPTASLMDDDDKGDDGGSDSAAGVVVHLLLVALFLLLRIVFFGVSDICFSFCRGLHKPGSFTLWKYY